MVQRMVTEWDALIMRLDRLGRWSLPSSKSGAWAGEYEEPLVVGPAVGHQRVMGSGSPAHALRAHAFSLRAIPVFPRTKTRNVASFADVNVENLIVRLFESGRLGSPRSVHQIVDDMTEVFDFLCQNVSLTLLVNRLKDRKGWTYLHSIAVSALMMILARESGSAKREVIDIGIAGVLHDVGKLLIDNHVLQKPSRLTDGERQEIERHPSLGHGLLSSVTVPDVVRDVCLHHHERIDGSGYPFAFQGPLVSHAARIAAVCDVYDAMTSDRPYRDGMSPQTAMGLLDTEVAGLDPGILFGLMCAIAVYPAGKVIRLRSERLAVILPSPPERGGSMARVFFDTVRETFIPYDDVLLGTRLATDAAIQQEDAMAWFGVDRDSILARVVAGRRMPERG